MTLHLASDDEPLSFFGTVTGLRTSDLLFLMLEDGDVSFRGDVTPSPGGTAAEVRFRASGILSAGTPAHHFELERDGLRVLFSLTGSNPSGPPAVRSGDSNSTITSSLENPVHKPQTTAHPFLLLPVRLESHCTETLTGLEIQLRVYPDNLAVVSRTPELSRREVLAGRAHRASLVEVDNDTTLAADTKDARRVASFDALTAAVRNRARARYVAAAIGRYDSVALDKLGESAQPVPAFIGLPERFVARVHFAGGIRDYGFKEITGDPRPFMSLQRSAALDPERVAWRGDFDKAVTAGMAVRIKVPASENTPEFRNRGVRIVVLGRFAGEASDGARAVGEWLEQKAELDELAFVPHGTATNHVQGERSDDALVVTVPESQRGAPPFAGARTASSRVARALGLVSSPALDEAEFADDLGDALAGAFVNDLWQPTFSRTGRLLGMGWHGRALRRHATQYVRPRGPLAPLRFGKTPYGLLPVARWSAWTPHDTDWSNVVDPGLGAAEKTEADATLKRCLDLLKRWFGEAARAPGRLPVSREGDFESRLPSLCMTPRSTSAAIRPMLPTDLLQMWVRLIGPGMFGPGTVFSLTGDVASWLKKFDDACAALGADITAVIAAASGAPIGYPPPIASLVPWHAVRDLALPFMVPEQYKTEIVPPEFFLPPRGEPASVYQWLVAGRDDPQADGPGRLRAWQPYLRGEEADRFVADTVDLWTHRLDAWIVSLFARRLDAMRSERPEGVLLGTYGVLDGVRPVTDQTAAVLGGRVHAPSIDQADAAAVIRSSWLLGTESQRQAFSAVDLSAQRIDVAKEISAQHRAGTSLAIILGSKVERWLHDAKLDRLKYSLRRTFPLQLHHEIDDLPDTMLTHADARIVDGEALMRAWRSLVSRDPSEWSSELSGIPELVEILDRLADVADASLDAYNFELAFHMTRLLERGGSTLDASAGKTRAAPLESLNTPVGGTDARHKIMCVFPENVAASDAPLVAVEPAVAAWIARGAPREPIEFRVYYRVGAQAGAAASDWRTEVLTIFPDTEGALHPLELATLFGDTSGGDSTGERWLQLIALEAIEAAGEVAAADIELETIRISDDVDGLAVPMALAWVNALAAPFAARGGALHPSHLSGTEDTFLAGDAKALRMRARALVDLASPLITDLEASAGLTLGAPALRGLLRRAARWNLPAALPTATEFLNSDLLRARAAQATATLKARRDILEKKLTEFDAQPTATDEAMTELAHAMRDTAGSRVEILPTFNPSTLEGLPPARTADLTGGRGASAVLSWMYTIGEVRRATTGALCEALSRAALVEPPPLTVMQREDRRAGESRPSDTDLAERWIALSVEEQSCDVDAAGATLAERDRMPFPPNRTSYIFVGRPEFTERISGFVFDSWTEKVPAELVDTGVAFHYDQPDAQAPQSILLVVPSVIDPVAPVPWTDEELYGAIDTALELAVLRLVDLDALLPTPAPREHSSPTKPGDVVWPPGQLLPGLYRQAPSIAQELYSEITTVVRGPG